MLLLAGTRLQGAVEKARQSQARAPQLAIDHRHGLRVVVVADDVVRGKPGPHFARNGVELGTADFLGPLD